MIFTFYRKNVSIISIFGNGYLYKKYNIYLIVPYRLFQYFLFNIIINITDIEIKKKRDSKT